MDVKALQKLEWEVHQLLFTETSLASEAKELVHNRTFLEHTIQKLLQQLRVRLDEKERQEVVEAVVNRVRGFGPLQELIYRPDITEIMVNGPKSVFVEKSGKLTSTDVQFYDDTDLLQTINKIVSAVGRHIDESSPMVDARLPDGSRVNAIIPPLSLNGPVLTIRKFSRVPFTLDRLVEMRTISADLARTLESLVKNRKNILIVGGTGSGKTSTLNALTKAVPTDQRLITIEDLAELQLQHPNVVGLEARPPSGEGHGEVTIRTLLRNALRMRPDRIIIGEIRGAEALDMLQAMNTGHDGSLTTIHANAALEGLIRLETLAITADANLPLKAIRQQIRHAIDVIVFQQRTADGTRKIRSVSTLAAEADEEGNYQLQHLFIDT